MRNIKRKLKYSIRAYGSTVGICAKQRFDGGPLCVIGEYLVRFLQFYLLVLIWQTLLHDPELVFLDEPTLGLDVLTKRQMIGFLKD